MSEKTERLHIEAAFNEARKHLYAIYRAQRMCELEDRRYKKYDARGFESASLEAGRLFALIELCPDLGETVNLRELREDARQAALVLWQEALAA